jgi:hypothetical protein
MLIVSSGQECGSTSNSNFNLQAAFQEIQPVFYSSLPLNADEENQVTGAIRVGIGYTHEEGVLYATISGLSNLVLSIILVFLSC